METMDEMELNEQEQQEQQEQMLDDFQLERMCNNNPDCGCKCMGCPFFAMNRRWHEEIGM